MTEQSPILCQSCIDRQVEDIGEAIGLYQGLPICDKCLGPIVDNVNNIGEQDSQYEPGSLVARTNEARLKLDLIEQIMEEWPLTADETLTCHEEFYNHKPPAIINIPLKDLEKIYSRRKGFLFAVRHKDERWATFISQEKQKAREEANLTGLEKSRKEVSKVKAQSGFSKKEKEKTAKALGISLDAYLEIEREAALKKFDAIVGATKDNPIQPAMFATNSNGNSSAKENLAKIQASKIEEKKLKINPFTGKPYA